MLSKITLLLILLAYSTWAENPPLDPLTNEFANAPKFILVIKHDYKMYLYEKGKLRKTYEIALSQNPGAKEREGDNRLPEGKYTICEKIKGPFGKDPWWHEYLGAAWLRINYPNDIDAERGLKNHLISQKEYDSILAANRENRIPPKNTGIGGGIGIHGWAESDWSNQGNRDLTWGCISMHNADLKKLYNWVDLRTPIVIAP